jgi:vacuolar-type H+-ATPase subunit D/Vma8
MTDLFEKLNLLVRSGLRDLVGSDHFDLDALRRALTPERMGKDLDREVVQLRQKVNEALDYEDELLQRVNTYTDEAARLDAEADDAVAANQQEAARALISQVQRAEQRLTMAESDLRAHRSVTQELIQRVNMLEAVVADAKANASAQPAPHSLNAPANNAADILRTAQEQASKPSDTVTVAVKPTDQKSVDDDLEQRRQRLSKP